MALEDVRWFKLAMQGAQRPPLSLRRESLASRWSGTECLYSLENAEPLAIVNDGQLHVMRAGATSAVAGRYLARKGSSVLGIIGASNRARGHARAYAAAFPLELVKVFSRTP